MGFSPQLAEIRFGFGLSPAVAAPRDESDMLGRVVGPDIMAARFPLPSYADFLPDLRAIRDIRRKGKGNTDKEAVLDRYRAAKNTLENKALGWAVNTMLRRTYSDAAFRERLVLFWSDHFTAFGKNQLTRFGTLTYVEDAVRPHVVGRFEDLLINAVLHPIMLGYLDQNISTGPNSRAAKNARKKRGLNENLAREVLELHTLGVNAPYTQDDVRQLAELLTGLTFDGAGRFAFRERMAEPGAETVLGKRYGGQRASLDAVHQVLRDLARHPATARHIAQKLAIHFVADRPPVALVTDLERAYLESGGDLLRVYDAMLSHPESWRLQPVNFKPPQDFMSSAWRSLAVDPNRAANLTRNDVLRLLMRPLRAMGQRFHRPNGPDGWPEPDSAWITPHGISHRMQWAMNAPIRLRPDLPDPRDFVVQALGDFANDQVLFAARAAESTKEAIGLVLMSPPFQRR